MWSVGYTADSQDFFVGGKFVIKKLSIKNRIELNYSKSLWLIETLKKWLSSELCDFFRN